MTLAEKLKTVAIAYAVIALVTFGVSAADPDRQCQIFGEPCPSGMERNNDAMAGLGAGLFWPLWWTWELSERAFEEQSQ